MSTGKNDLSNIFSQNLALCLADEGFTQDELAQAIGVSQSAVNKWLRGTLPGSGELSKIAKALNTTPSELLGWEKASARISTSTALAGVLADAANAGEPEKQEIFERLVLAVGILQTSLDESEKQLAEGKRQLGIVFLEVNRILPPKARNVKYPVLKPPPKPDRPFTDEQKVADQLGKSIDAEDTQPNSTSPDAKAKRGRRTS